MLLVFVGIGSLGDALGLASVAVEVAQRGKSSVTVRFVSHSEHEFPLRKLLGTSRWGLLQYRPLKGLNALNGNVPGQSPADAAFDELNLVHSSCDASDNTQPTQNASLIAFNLFAAHVFHVAEAMGVPALCLAPTIAPPVATEYRRSAWIRFAARFPELATTLSSQTAGDEDDHQDLDEDRDDEQGQESPKNDPVYLALKLCGAIAFNIESTAPISSAAVVQQSKRKRERETHGVERRGHGCPTRWAVEHWMLPLFEDHYQRWRRAHNLPPFHESVLAGCKIGSTDKERRSLPHHMSTMEVAPVLYLVPEVGLRKNGALPWPSCSPPPALAIGYAYHRHGIDEAAECQPSAARERLRAFLASGERPYVAAVVDLGSMPNLLAGDALSHNNEDTSNQDYYRSLIAAFYKEVGPSLLNCAEASRYKYPSQRMESTLKVVFLTRGLGGNGDLYEAVEASCDALNRSASSSSAFHLCDEPVPHEWLFSHLADTLDKQSLQSTTRTTTIFISHGGAGSVGAALRAGILQLVVPLAFDQGFWGEQVANQLRCGEVVDLNFDDFDSTDDSPINEMEIRAKTRERLSRAVARLLLREAEGNEMLHRAKEVSSALQACEGRDIQCHQNMPCPSIATGSEAAAETEGVGRGAKIAKVRAKKEEARDGESASRGACTAAICALALAQRHAASKGRYEAPAKIPRCSSPLLKLAC